MLKEMREKIKKMAETVVDEESGDSANILVLDDVLVLLDDAEKKLREKLSVPKNVKKIETYDLIKEFLGE